jgi:rhamnulokinase
MGGGSQNTYLNALAAEYTGKTVRKGPTEATALGNVITQMVYTGTVRNVEAAREIIRNTCEKGDGLL